jgi:hypothetical protein
MNRKIRRYCQNCGDQIYEGEPFSYPHGPDVYEDDFGEYFDGGACTKCGRELCATCGEFDDGVCRDCVENKVDDK